MRIEFLISLRMTVVTLVMTGLAYPVLVTGLAQFVFPRQANGSMITQDGRIVGSSLIAQSFSGPAYFQPRPSAAGTEGFDAMASSGSNLGPISSELLDRVTTAAARLREENPDAPGPIPMELLTTSASGLDPHLSPTAARWQAARVAAARQAPLADVQALIDARVEGRTLGLLGEPRVNVLLLNLDLDGRLGRPALLPRRPPRG